MSCFSEQQKSIFLRLADGRWTHDVRKAIGFSRCFSSMWVNCWLKGVKTKNILGRMLFQTAGRRDLCLYTPRKIDIDTKNDGLENASLAPKYG